MESLQDEIIAKEATILKLNKLIGKKDLKINKLEVEVLKFKNRAVLAENKLAPIKIALDNLTAEKSKWLRKCKRKES